ncbi:MAG: hypothetical protein KKF68_01160 [Nanoarchaeota archaeon]|nr:hypothetical protein [Nanoarchaeota archaeon]
MNNRELIEKITKKKEFSQLPQKDVEFVFEKFDKRKIGDEEKVRLTRDLLRKIFSAFTSKKILSLKDKNPEWILRKHLSTRERLPFYSNVYKRILKNFKCRINIFDLGAGVNGFSYEFFKKNGYDVNYVGIEAIGQLVDLMNFYFKKSKFNASAVHLSLFELSKVKKIIQKQKKPRIVFLFKTLDSLEMIERNYSKRLISEILPFVDLIVVSFATKSMIRRESFKVKRHWLVNFIKDNFEILDDFEIGGERYIVFKKKKNL